MAHTLAQLRALTDDEIVRLYDEAAPNTALWLNFYRDELVRRQVECQGDRMEAMTRRIESMTRTMLRLTIVISVLTVIIAVLGAVPLLRP